MLSLESTELSNRKGRHVKFDDLDGYTLCLTVLWRVVLRFLLVL